MTIFNYTVNYIDVAICAIFLIFTILGCKKGIFITVVNFIRYSLGFMLCFFCSENLYQPLYNNYIKEKLHAAIEQNITNSEDLDVITKNLNEISADFPPVLKNYFDFSDLEKVSSKNLADYVLDNVFEPIALIFSKIVIFIAVFLLFFIATGLIVHMIKKAQKKKESPLKTVDKIVGGIFGLLKSFVLVLAITSVLMYILSLGENIVQSSHFMQEVQQSTLLEFINEINPFNAITRGII